jgi:biopolymer transport protein ExbD
MNLRGHAQFHHPGIQLAPLVDVLLLLLIFFLLTWNAARNENEIDIKVPKSSTAKENPTSLGPIVINVRADGTMMVNKQVKTAAELQEQLKGIVQYYGADQPVIIRGDEAGAYKNIVGVLDICTTAGITNIAFATAK